MFCTFLLRGASNVPSVIQRDVLICEQSNSWHVSLQTYTTAVGRCFLWSVRAPNAFVHLYTVVFRGQSRTCICTSALVSTNTWPPQLLTTKYPQKRRGQNQKALICMICYGLVFTEVVSDCFSEITFLYPPVSQKAALVCAQNRSRGRTRRPVHQTSQRQRAENERRSKTEGNSNSERW